MAEKNFAEPLCSKEEFNQTISGIVNSFLDMMEDTGSGYLFHSDSSEYDKMMQTLRAVKQLSGKVPLNDYEMKTYADSCANIAKVCTDYLDREQKLKKQRSDTGSDRFDGALGILNLMDPEAADRIRMKAGEKRGKRIRWEDLNEKAAEKERKRPKKSEIAVVKNSASHLLH